MTARGRFLSIEGGEGVGKSTQIVAMAEVIRNAGHDVILTREPGGTQGAEAIRQLLLGGSNERWLPHAEALLFASEYPLAVEEIAGRLNSDRVDIALAERNEPRCAEGRQPCVKFFPRATKV